MSKLLDADEAAARLGVKKQTLYAYVSRELLSRHGRPGDRRSYFDADEVDQLRAERRRRAPGEVGTVIASRVTRVSEDGLQVAGEDVERWVERGWDVLVEQLVGRASPPPAPLRQAARAAQRALPPSAALVDRLRATVVATAAADPARHDRSPSAVRRRAVQLVDAMVEALPQAGAPLDGRTSDRLWSRLSKDRRRARRDALDAALVLLTDHGLATSTFAVRVAASTRADVYSAVLAGLAALGGPLHGAASAAAHDLYARAEQIGADAAIGEALGRGPLPGVGHSVYRSRDPREVVLFRVLHDGWDTTRVQQVRDHLARDRLVNVDAAVGALTHLARMPRDAGEGIFAIARTVGWVAHYLEELDEEPLRFRPRARVVGDRASLGPPT